MVIYGDDYDPRNPPDPTERFDDSEYSSHIGEYADTTYQRLVPGDIIIRGYPNSGHVTIVNFVTGERGNNDEESSDCRNDNDIHLIQAIGGSDNPQGYNSRMRIEAGRVTDHWRWQTMASEEEYHARRILQ
jgi:hypothetical protein